MSLDIAPMRPDDLDAVDGVWQQAFGALRAMSPNPPAPRTDEAAANDRRRLEHLCTTDPEGCHVARLEGAVVGFAESHVREGTFVLAMLGVLPDFQDQGIGAALLGEALAYSRGCSNRYIFSSTDPRALHRYVRAGFTLHPTIAITSRPRDGATAAVALRLSEGGEGDLDLVEEIDRAVRGSGRRVDIAFWLSVGQRLVLDDRGAYAIIGNGRLTVLGASSEGLARELLTALLAGYPEGGVLALNWVAPEQAWAVEVAASCSASLRVAGAVMTEGVDTLPVPYLPNGLFG